jgi:hypothetical protein
MTSGNAPAETIGRRFFEDRTKLVGRWPLSSPLSCTWSRRIAHPYGWNASGRGDSVSRSLFVSTTLGPSSPLPRVSFRHAQTPGGPADPLPCWAIRGGSSSQEGNPVAAQSAPSATGTAAGSTGYRDAGPAKLTRRLKQARRRTVGGPTELRRRSVLLAEFVAQWGSSKSDPLRASRIPSRLASQGCRSTSAIARRP